MTPSVRHSRPQALLERVIDTIHMRASPSEKSPPGNPTISKKRQPPDLMISTNSLPNNDEIPDNSDVQRAMYSELTKISKSLEALAAATETGPPVSARRSSGFFTGASLEAAEYDALGQQFTTLVIISTFTANLIIGFLTLAHNILSSRKSYSMIQYEFGMFFALGGMAIHAGVIIIAGRSAALALKYAKRIPVQAHVREERQREKQRKNANSSGSGSSPSSDSSDRPLPATSPSFVTTERSEGQDHRAIPPSDPSSSTRIASDETNLSKPKLHQRFAEDTPIPIPTTPHSPVPSLALTESPQALQLFDFHRFLKACESLQLMGTATFFLGVMILIFIMFFNRVFPILLSVGCLVGSCLMSWIIEFWKVSATNQLLRVARNCWKGWREVDVTVPDETAYGSKLKKKGKESVDGAGKARSGWRRLPRRPSQVHWEADPEKGKGEEKGDLN